MALTIWNQTTLPTQITQMLFQYTNSQTLDVIDIILSELQSDTNHTNAILNTFLLTSLIHNKPQLASLLLSKISLNSNKMSKCIYYIYIYIYIVGEEMRSFEVSMRKNSSNKRVIQGLILISNIIKSLIIWMSEEESNIICSELEEVLVCINSENKSISLIEELEYILELGLGYSGGYERDVLVMCVRIMEFLFVVVEKGKSSNIGDEYRDKLGAIIESRGGVQEQEENILLITQIQNIHQAISSQLPHLAPDALTRLCIDKFIISVHIQDLYFQYANKLDLLLFCTSPDARCYFHSIGFLRVILGVKEEKEIPTRAREMADDCTQTQIRGEDIVDTQHYSQLKLQYEHQTHLLNIQKYKLQEALLKYIYIYIYLYICRERELLEKNWMKEKLEKMNKIRSLTKAYLIQSDQTEEFRIENNRLNMMLKVSKNVLSEI